MAASPVRVIESALRRPTSPGSSKASGSIAFTLSMKSAASRLI